MSFCEAFNPFYDEKVKVETRLGIVRDVSCSIMSASTDDPLLEDQMGGSLRQAIEIVFPSYSQNVPEQTTVGDRVTWKGKTWTVYATRQDFVLGTILNARERSDGPDGNAQI